MSEARGACSCRAWVGHRPIRSWGGTDDDDDNEGRQTTLTWEALRPWLAAAGRRAMSTCLSACLVVLVGLACVRGMV